MGGYGSGGLNKRKNCISHYDFADSFFRNDKDSKDFDILYNGEVVGEIIFSEVPNNFGGRPRKYFICPCCGGRYRFLYWCWDKLICRKCGNLNYPTQQSRVASNPKWWSDMAHLFERVERLREDNR